jgi:hypothetical protein
MAARRKGELTEIRLRNTIPVEWYYRKASDENDFPKAAG